VGARRGAGGIVDAGGGYAGWIGDAVRDCVNAGQSANCITGAS